MIKLAVVGNPVFHSLSPYVFNIFSQKSDYQIKYQRISAPSINDAFNFAKEIGLTGFNVTSPFKTDVLELLDKIDYQAANLNSANTVKFVENQSTGFNTDYFGILSTIWDNNFIFNKQKVLILGAGAAGRTAAFAIRNLNSIVYIWDRNLSKSQKVSQEVGIQYITTEQVIKDLEHFRYIISTIPQNSEILSQLNFSEKNIIFDTIYHNSFFQKNQTQFGYQLISGERWLINQASLSFEIFIGHKPKNLPLVQDLQKVKKEKHKSFILLGFSGSGKTTIGKQVAKNLGADFYDIDSLIEQKLNKSIKEIFENEGEAYFRQIENQILSKISQEVSSNSTSKTIIISAGGGILSNQDNLKYIHQLGFSIWMYSPIESCLYRLKNQNNRPLIKDYQSALELYNSRKDDYFLHTNGIFLNTTNESNAVTRLTNELARLI